MEKKQREKFGTVLGLAFGRTPVYSNNQHTKEKSSTFDQKNFSDGIFCGYKWQSVEFVRRCLIENFNCTFDSIAMAYDIFNLTTFTRLDEEGNAKNEKAKFTSCLNGKSNEKPKIGGIIIWEESLGKFSYTGHVAVVVDVKEDKVFIAEQNCFDEVWEKEKNYSRILKLTKDGNYSLKDEHVKRAVILGWINHEEKYVEKLKKRKVKTKSIDEIYRITPSSLKKVTMEVDVSKIKNYPESWLDLKNETQKAWALSDDGLLVPKGKNSVEYFTMSHKDEKKILSVSKILDFMFFKATERVLLYSGEDVLSKFEMPRSLWPKLRKSFETRKFDTISGRLDFSFAKDGQIKVYEYNADSASCLMEAGFTQDLWTRTMGINSKYKNAKNPGEKVMEKLTNTWIREKNKKGIELLHLFRDVDLEEVYHTLYMKDAAVASGIKNVKIQVGVNGLKWNEKGQILDSDGEIIRFVWKTWSWETIFRRIREEKEISKKEGKKYLDSVDQFKNNLPPRLRDVLLHSDICVYEPLWRWIPASKAILPILHEMYPDHPLLLPSYFELTDSLKDSGYVEKPISGRIGANIALYSPKENKAIEKSESEKFKKSEKVYQSLFPLPKFDKVYCQVNVFVVGHDVGGIVLRTDEKKIINCDSDIPNLVIIDE